MPIKFSVWLPSCLKINHTYLAAHHQLSIVSPSALQRFCCSVAQSFSITCVEANRQQRPIRHPPVYLSTSLDCPQPLFQVCWLLCGQQVDSATIMASSTQQQKKIAGITAAVAATAAAGYYVYDQYSKRYPRYQEQQALFKEVRPSLLVHACLFRWLNARGATGLGNASCRLLLCVPQVDE